MRLVLRNGTIIDGTGRRPLVGASIVIEGNTISAILETPDQAAATSGVESIDCSGKFILPGLVDAHVHLAFSAGQTSEGIIRQVVEETNEALALRELRNAQECLLGGMTTVRDCGDKNNTTLAVRDAISSGLVPGPRILASGMPITSTFGHLYWCGLEVDGLDQVRVAVRRLAKDGVDLIKVMLTGGHMDRNPNPHICRYSQAELNVLCEEARCLDKRVAAHVAGFEGIRRCVEAGVNTLAHCGWGNPDGSSGYDPELVDRMAAQGAFVDVTTGGPTRQNLADGRISASERERMFEGWATRRAMKAAGVKIVASTDAGCLVTAFRDFHLSLQMYGMMMDISPLETLSAATRIPAEALSLADEIGTLEAGKQADILILDADPLQDLANLRSVHMVLKGESQPSRRGS